MTNDYRPFNLRWLDSSYQQTCLPDSPWQKILDQIEPILAKQIRGQFVHPHRRQILFELLGKEFLWKYFPTEIDRPHLLNLNEEERQKLENEAKSWLQLQTHRAAIEVRAALHQSDSTSSLSIDMKEYLEYVDQILRKSLERHFYQIHSNESPNEKISSQEFRGGAKIRAMLRNSRTNSKKLPIIDETPPIVQTSIKSNYTESLSNSLVVLLKRDIRWIGFIKEKLFGQQLSSTLRQWIWTECLLRFERKPSDVDLSSVELQTRRDFAAGIRHGKNELKLTNPSQTPISNLIENAVIETYSSVTSLQPYLEEHYLRLTIKILNILYTFRKSYQSFSIYWLFPFQQIFREEMNEDDGIYLIAMHLNLFVRHCFPQWAKVFSIAQKILDDLSIEDERFSQHLKNIAKIRPKVNPKDFMSEMISLENGSSRKFLHELSSEPVIYLRKWIGQIFVGIVNSNAVLFLWDQFFLVKWNPVYLEYTGKAILYLLRDCFFAANDYEQMRKVFIDEPAQLFTSDIQTAFIHFVLRRGNPRMIASMNRRLYPLQTLTKLPHFVQRSNDEFDSIVVKNLSLTLVLRKDEFFDIRALFIDVEIYAANEKLTSESTRTIPIVRSKQVLIQPWIKFMIDIVNEKLRFRLKDIRQTLITSRIQALIVVRLQIDDLTKMILGHCRFPLYIPQKIGQLDTWDVTFGPVLRALHPGPPPLSIDLISDVPRTFFGDKIGPGSSVSLVIFDSKAEAHFQSSL